jgi:hypothetical protein
MSFIQTYLRHFDEFFGRMEYSKAAKAFKASAIFAIDSDSWSEHKDLLKERMAALEAARPIMDFDQLCIAESVCRYVRKRIKELEPKKYGAGLSREPTPEEAAEQARLTEAYGTSMGDLPNGVKKPDGFADDLRNDDLDDD